MRFTPGEIKHTLRTGEGMQTFAAKVSKKAKIETRNSSTPTVKLFLVARSSHGRE